MVLESTKPEKKTGVHLVEESSGHLCQAVIASAEDAPYASGKLRASLTSLHVALGL